MSQLGMSINVSAALFSETTKPDFFFDETITKPAHAFKIIHTLTMLKS